MLLPCRCDIEFCSDLAGRSFPYVEVTCVLEKGKMTSGRRPPSWFSRTFWRTKTPGQHIAILCGFLENRMNRWDVEKREESDQGRVYIPSPPPTPSSDDVSQRTHHRHHMGRKHHLLSEVKTSCLIIIASYHPSIYLSYAHPVAHVK